MNRLWYVWTEGHHGATGEGPSGPIRQKPVLATSEVDAIAKVRPTLSSWDGRVKLATTDEDYAPRRTHSW
jgi:hypothetical protein